MQQKGFAVCPKRNCPHVKIDWVNEVNNMFDTLGPQMYPGKCKDCQDSTENWICLQCATIFCSRYVKGHMAEHYEQEKHPVALSFADGSFWCYECDSYITSMPLNCCRNKFSEKVKFPNGEAVDEEEMRQLNELFGKAAKISEGNFGKKKEQKQPEIEKKEKVTRQTIVDGLKNGKYKKVVFLTGAGISVSSGIPDFRSPGTGLYSKLEKYNLPRAEAVFELQYFKSNPQPFYQVSKELFMTEGIKPAISHRFIKMFHDRGILLKSITQNIDSLELEAGLPVDKLIQAHGHSRSARCITCKKEVSIDIWNNSIKEGTPLKCIVTGCASLVKADIVFFGESLPKEFQEAPDLVTNADLVIIMGTSLKVFPFAFLATMVSEEAPIVLINNQNSLSWGQKNAIWLDGSLDEQVEKLIKDLGWEEKA